MIKILPISLIDDGDDKRIRFIFKSVLIYSRFAIFEINREIAKNKIFHTFDQYCDHFLKEIFANRITNGV